MKKLMLAGVAVAALASAPAMAADIPLKAAPKVVAAYNWTGCYVGLHFGLGIGKNKNDFGTAVASGATEGFEGFPAEFGPFDHNTGGGVAGGQLGCNYQVAASSWLIGLEGEGLWSGIKGNFAAAEDGSDPGSFSRFESSNRWDANLALRLGYALDRSLWYGKVGAAVGNFQYTETHDDFPTVHSCPNQAVPGNGTCSVSLTNTRFGLLLGFGWELAASDNVTFKIEYNYINFGSTNISYPSASAAIQSFSVKDTKNIIKVGINYRFNTASVVAKY
jgi:outer membrane immunogenic protein